MKESSTIKIIIPPPIVTLMFSGFMYALNLFFNFQIVSQGQAWVVTILFLISAILLFPALIQFYRSKTTVNPLKPETSKVLVVKGMYQYSRNPMYLGMASMLLAWAVFLANPFNIVIFVGFILYMNRFQIKLEEDALEIIFGEEFNQYKNNVRRWI